MRQVVGFQLFLCELNSVEPFLYFSSSRDGDGFDVVGHMLCLVFFFFLYVVAFAFRECFCNSSRRASSGYDKLYLAQNRNS